MERPPTDPTTPDPATELGEEVREEQFDNVDQAKEFLEAQLFEPSCVRIVAITRTLIEVTGVGDHAFWLPMAAAHVMLRELNWAAAPKWQTQRLLRLVVRASEEMAASAESMLDTVNTLEPSQPFPEFPEWGADRTLRLMTEVAAEYPEPAK
jgi:hypothetical protein